MGDRGTELEMRLAIAALLLPLTGAGHGPNESAESFRTRIEALKPAAIAWRQIQWKSCLLDGLRESREKKKPLIVWVFIDRPADDARC